MIVDYIINNFSSTISSTVAHWYNLTTHSRDVDGGKHGYPILAPSPYMIVGFIIDNFDSTIPHNLQEHVSSIIQGHSTSAGVRDIVF